MRTVAEPGAVITPVALTQEPSKPRPVVGWAVLGGLFLVFQVFLYVRWVLAGDFTRTDAGPSPLAGWEKVSVVGWQIVMPLVLAIGVYWFIWRPWRAERKLTLDGSLLIVFFMLHWQDPLWNYSQNHGVYNSHLLNFGNWIGGVPGVIAPNAEKVGEPILWIAPVYAMGILIPVILTSWVMHKAKARWSGIGTLGLIGVAFATAAFAFFPLEVLWMRCGLYAYPGVDGWLGIFAGSRYQYPLYEFPLIGFTLALFASIRYFKDDKGRTVAERGIDRIKGTPGQKSVIRLLALTGMINAIFLVLYNVPVNVFGMNSEAWPSDLTRRSYMTDEVCGPHWDIACPSPSNPILRRTSGHLNWEGEYVPAKGATR